MIEGRKAISFGVMGSEFWLLDFGLVSHIENRELKTRNRKPSVLSNWSFVHK